MPAPFARVLLLASLLLPSPATAQPTAPTTYERAIAAGYKASMLCSGIFNAGRSEAQVEADELKGIYPQYAAILPELKAVVDRRIRTVTVAFDETLPPRRAAWSRGFGCTNMPIGHVPMIVTGYDAPLSRAVASDALPWPMGDRGALAARKPSAALTALVGRAFDRASFGKDSETTGVVVVQDGRIIAERYREGFDPNVSNRTWSVAKSIAGTLIGIAAQQKLVDIARPARIPEWGTVVHDPRGRITLDNLLRMASGLHSDTAGNRTDAIYFGGTAVTDQAIGWPLGAKPGTRFRYANNDTLLAIRALRATVGDARYAAFLQTELFDKIGMTRTVAERDWRDNFILSSQVWSTARDLARLGLLYVNDGVWQGERLLPADWVDYVTRPSGPQPETGPGYGAAFWLFGPDQGLPAGSYAAQGNRGQYVMIVPSRKLVIVRRGEDPGGARFDIAKFSADMLAALANRN